MQQHQVYSLSGEFAPADTDLPRQLRRQDLLFASLLAVIFILLTPVMEWPDAMDHIAKRLAQQTIYPPDIFSLYATLPTPVSNGGHSYFADHYMYQPLSGYFWVNLERLPVVLMAIVGLHMLVKKVDGALLLFCPPLIYSLTAPSQEVIAISILLAAAIIIHRYPIGAVLLAALAMAIDRSMAPSGAFVMLYVAVSPYRSVVFDLRLVVLVGVLLLVGTAFVSPLDLIGEADNKTKLFFGLTVEDVRAGAQLGHHKFFALAASTMGLYGWMSIRPFPFWIYYPVIMLLFTVGFATSQSSRQSLFIALLLVSCLVLWLIPSLSQARYYPLLTLAFWSMVISGARAVKIKPVALFIFVVGTSAAGCMVSLLNST